MSTSSNNILDNVQNLSPASTPSSVRSIHLDLNVEKPLPPPPPASSSSSSTASPNPTRSLSATTLTMHSPPSGGGSQTKRHNVRSNSASQHRQASSSSLDRSMSQPPIRPTSPITSPSIHKSLTALDAKSIARDMEKSAFQLRGDDVLSPGSPNNSQNASNFYFSNNASSFQSIAAPQQANAHFQYHRQNSLSSITLPNNVPQASLTSTIQGDAWQTLCVRVLPLFNGEGVQGAIEDLNDLLR